MNASHRQSTTWPSDGARSRRAARERVQHQVERDRGGRRVERKCQRSSPSVRSMCNRLECAGPLRLNHWLRTLSFWARSRRRWHAEHAAKVRVSARRRRSRRRRRVAEARRRRRWRRRRVQLEPGDVVGAAARRFFRLGDACLSARATGPSRGEASSEDRHRPGVRATAPQAADARVDGAGGAGARGRRRRRAPRPARRSRRRRFGA